MNYRIVTLENAVSPIRQIELRNCMSIEVVIGTKIFTISENNYDKTLDVRVDKKLLIEPKSNNSISVDEG